jgi:cytochrome c oxidase cbb3-type subunit 3
MKSKMRIASIVVSVAALGTFLAGPVAAMEQGKLEPKIAAADTADANNNGEHKVPSSNPLSGDPEAIELGQRLFFTWCVQCHGPKADGNSRFGKYAGNLTIFWRGYPEFVKIVQDGRVKKMMPPWKEVLDEDAISKIGAYLETLAKEGANWQ